MQSVLVPILHTIHVLDFTVNLQPSVGICQKQNQSIETRVDDYSENQNDVFANPVRVLLRSMRNDIQLTYSVITP